MSNTQRRVLLFFILAFVLAIPFWLVGASTDVQLLPGLPVAALATFCPMFAAAIVVSREVEHTRVRELLARSFDFNRIKVRSWYLPALLTMPAVMTLSFIALRLAGTDVPTAHINPVMALILCAIFFVAALGEELGWSGYAIDPMQARWGALVAAILLGGLWAVYHYVGLVQAQRSLEWIAWWTLYTVAGRVILVWLYNNTGGSVFAATLFHMTINVTWQLFPVEGSYFDPRVTGLILALLAVLILLLWGGRSLDRFRLA